MSIFSGTAMLAQSERGYNAILFFQLSVPGPVSFTLGIIEEISMAEYLTMVGVIFRCIYWRKNLVIYFFQ